MFVQLPKNKKKLWNIYMYNSYLKEEDKQSHESHWNKTKQLQPSQTNTILMPRLLDTYNALSTI